MSCLGVDPGADGLEKGDSRIRSARSHRPIHPQNVLRGPWPSRNETKVHWQGLECAILFTTLSLSFEKGVVMANRALFSGLLAALVLGLAGCGGGDTEVRSEITTTTKGQQLIDLKKALDGGAMTQEEYERERQRILKAE